MYAWFRNLKWKFFRKFCSSSTPVSLMEQCQSCPTGSTPTLDEWWSTTRWIALSIGELLSCSGTQASVSTSRSPPMSGSPWSGDVPLSIRRGSTSHCRYSLRRINCLGIWFGLSCTWAQGPGTPSNPTCMWKQTSSGFTNKNSLLNSVMQVLLSPVSLEGPLNVGSGINRVASFPRFLRSQTFPCWGNWKLHCGGLRGELEQGGSWLRQMLTFQSHLSLSSQYPLQRSAQDLNESCNRIGCIKSAAALELTILWNLNLQDGSSAS